MMYYIDGTWQVHKGINYHEVDELTFLISEVDVDT